METKEQKLQTKKIQAILVGYECAKPIEIYSKSKLYQLNGYWIHYYLTKDWDQVRVWVPFMSVRDQIGYFCYKVYLVNPLEVMDIDEYNNYEFTDFDYAEKRGARLPGLKES